MLLRRRRRVELSSSISLTAAAQSGDPIAAAFVPLSAFTLRSLSILLAPALLSFFFYLF